MANEYCIDIKHNWKEKNCPYCEIEQLQSENEKLKEDIKHRHNCFTQLSKVTKRHINKIYRLEKEVKRLRG
jgi:predicted nuclease with TOPRIM domain